MHENRDDVLEPQPVAEAGLNGHAEGAARAGDDPRAGGAASAEDSVWTVLGTLYRWRWFVAAVTTLVAIGAVVVSLLLPNWYAAAVRVLPPEASGANPLASALLRGGAGSAASMLFGGASSDYARYLSILSSRRVLESVVEEFDLVEAYELGDTQHPTEAAIAEFSQNVSFPIDEEYEFLSIVVLDRDPQRAADIANFMVGRLNAINTELASENAGNYREFVEARYNEAQTALDSTLDATQAFQEQYGVLDLDVQAQAYFSQLAGLEASATAAQIQYEALRAQLGDENEEVQALRAVAQAAQREVGAVRGGEGGLLQVPQTALSTVARRYVDLQRETLVQGQILEVIRPLVEQARFEEEKTVEAVQIVDPAVPPVRKAKPVRSVLVVTATLSGFLITVVFVLLYAGWRRHSGYVAARLRRGVERAAPKADAALPR